MLKITLGFFLVLAGAVSMAAEPSLSPKISQAPQIQAPFSQEELKTLLKDYLQTRISLAGDFEVNLTNQRLTIPRKTEADKLNVIDVTMSENQQTFEARIEQISGEEKIILQPLLGKIQSLAEIPTLTRAVMPGEEIVEADITWQKIPSARLSQTFITRKEDVIGKISISKVLQPGQPLYRSDVKAPVVIKKGDMVTVSYRSDGLFLSSQLQASQDGGRGEMIRFVSPVSKKEVQAKVLGPSEAEIRPAGM